MYTHASHIAKLVEDSEVEQLQELSYHCIKNAFSDIVFCDPYHGINGATLVELLHVLQHGLFLYWGVVLYGQKQLKKSAYKKLAKMKKEAANKDQDQDDNINDDEEKQEEEEDQDDNSNDDDDEKQEEEELDDDNEEEEEDLEEEEEDEDKDEDDQEDDIGLDDFLTEFSQVNKDELSRNGVFTDSVKKDVDKWAKQYG